MNGQQASPLGRYSDLVAALTAAALVIAALWAHTLGAGSLTDTAWLDSSAGVAIGVILGQRATTNGAAKIAATAHKRLDAIHAPPADAALEEEAVGG